MKSWWLALLAAASFAAAQEPPPEKPKEEAGGIKLLNFRGGGTCYAGLGRLIALETDIEPAAVRVEMSSDGGETWSAVPRKALRPVRPGLIWRPMPAEPGDAYRIRVSVTDAAGRTFSDASEENFKIEPVPQENLAGPVRFTVKFPPAMRGGIPLEIGWEARDEAERVSLYVLFGGKRQLLARDQPAVGSAQWDVPEIDAKDCRILLEIAGRTVMSHPFEIDSTPPGLRGVEVEIPRR